MHFRHDPAGTTVIAKRRQEKPMMKHDPDVQDLTARYGTRVLDPVRAPGRHAIAAWALAVAVALAAFLGPPLTRQAVAAVLELRHSVLMLDRELERVWSARKTIPAAASLAWQWSWTAPTRKQRT
jgi:hypothetical protein